VAVWQVGGAQAPGLTEVQNGGAKTAYRG
jgi:hypothetical protein